MSTDVIVVGGGLMGCAIALRLRQAGASVIVLERSIPGAEASSAAGGILAPQKEAEAPGPTLELGLRSRALYPALAEELLELAGLDIQYRPSGLLHVAFSDDALQQMDATVAWQKAFGLRAELLDVAQARELEPVISPSALGAIHFPDDHQVDNRLLVRAMSIAAARAGAQFRTGYVRSVSVQEDRVVGVDLDGQQLSASSVVIAAGSWSGLVHGARIDPQTIRPARGQMIELETRVPLFDRVLFSSRKGYLVPRRDGRILAGSTMEFAGFEKDVTAAGLSRILTMALEMCPGLGEVRVTNFWAGLRPYTEDHLPFIGPGPLPGLFLATGHYRNGILLAPMTARLVAESVLGRKPAVDLSPFRWDRNPPASSAAAHGQK